MTNEVTQLTQAYHDAAVKVCNALKSLPGVEKNGYVEVRYDPDDETMHLKIVDMHGVEVLTYDTGENTLYLNPIHLDSTPLEEVYEQLKKMFGQVPKKQGIAPLPAHTPPKNKDVLEL